MGNYACLHCFSLANSSVRLLIACAQPDYMHFLSFVQFLSCLFSYYLCWIYVLEVRINIIIIIIIIGLKAIATIDVHTKPYSILHYTAIYIYIYIYIYI